MSEICDQENKNVADHTSRTMRACIPNSSWLILMTFLFNRRRFDDRLTLRRSFDMMSGAAHIAHIVM